MTEEELRDRIFRAARRQPDSRQPPFVETVFDRHPDRPEDYAQARSAAWISRLGEADKVYRPALGAPCVDIFRYPPGGGRSFWCYCTDGMSDFPQIVPQGVEIRTELVACTGTETPLAANLLHSLSILPFKEGSAFDAVRVLPLPEGIDYDGFAHVLLIEPRLSPVPPSLNMAGHEVRILMVLAVSGEEYALARRHSPEVLVKRALREDDAWLLDGRFGLAVASRGREDDRAASVQGLGCLVEATDSPCPRCGGELREDELPEDPDPFLVCRDCGWSRAVSSLEHARPYFWAVERCRQELGADVVDFDVRPGGEGIIVRVNAPGKGPAIVELKSPVFDINRLPDRDQVLEGKLAKLRAYLAS